MHLPIQFPSDTDVILEDVARFRALSQEERIRAIQSLLADGAYLMSRSPKAAWIEEDAEEQGRLKRQSIQEFIARHGR
jgi:hypothetical protein